MIGFYFKIKNFIVLDFTRCQNASYMLLGFCQTLESRKYELTRFGQTVTANFVLTTFASF